MFLTTAFKKTLQNIKHHKWLFLALFFTQLLFLIVFFLIHYKYQVAVVQNFKDILGPLEAANYNTTQLSMGLTFTPEMSQILQSWDQLKTNAQYLLFFSFLTFAILNGFSWSLTHYLIKKQNLFKLWGKFIALSTVFFIPYLIIIFSIFQTGLLESDPVNSAKLIGVLAFIFTYFALIAFSLLDLNFKEIFKKTFWPIGIKKFYFVLLFYLIIAVILSLISYLLYYAVNFWHISLVALFIVLLILAINIGRLFLIHSVSELA